MPARDIKNAMGARPEFIHASRRRTGFACLRFVNRALPARQSQALRSEAHEIVVDGQLCSGGACETNPRTLPYSQGVVRKGLQYRRAAEAGRGRLTVRPHRDAGRDCTRTGSRSARWRRACSPYQKDEWSVVGRCRYDLIADEHGRS